MFYRKRNLQQRVNYAALNVEELGSVYESLLDFRPMVSKEPEGRQFELGVGSERKTTGSYYTRPELVRELIQSALVPVIENRLAEAEKQAKGQSPEAIRNSKSKAILDISVCDPACGSGHFILEAARRLGKELARIRVGEDEPTPEQFHVAVRDVISHCIHGVDMNPLAVDLCKLALWLEGHWAGKPLSFLDHRIRCGNSLIGVVDRAILTKGIPDEAFNPVSGDDKKIAAAYKKRNKLERSLGQKRLEFEQVPAEHSEEYAELFGIRLDFPEDKPSDVKRKADLFEKARGGADWWHDWTAANLWTASFFVPFNKLDDPHIPTHEIFSSYLLHRKDRPQMTGFANSLAGELHFFHWHLEFPDVFEKGGFDVILGNPPWERIKLQEEEHWASDPYIASAPNKSQRSQRIEEYRLSGDSRKQELVTRFDIAKHNAEATSKFMRGSERYPLTAVGDINTYALFAETVRTLISSNGRTGVIVPTGVATDDTNKNFFGDLNRKGMLASLFDFENREALFPAVDSRMKFSLLTLSANSVEASAFACYLTRTEQLRDAARRFELTSDDFALFNPNTRTCPIFRTRTDAALTKKIYQRVPVLINEATDKNSWEINYLRFFDMSNDSDLFQSHPKEGFLPLYEGKMVQAYDHRAAGVITNLQNIKRPGQPVVTTIEEHHDPRYLPNPQYWVPESAVRERMPDWYLFRWFLGFKSVTSPTNERTFIATLLPWSAVSNSMPLMLTKQKDPRLISCLLANLNALVFDYVARQKVGGVNLNFFIINQLPALTPDSYLTDDVAFISSRVVELVYTATDMGHFARDMGCDSKPFSWDEERRGAIMGELNAYYAHLYGFTRQELQYVLDPHDVCGPEFPSETFRGLRENEEQEYGEYRTRTLALAAFDRLSRSDRFRDEKRECAITCKTWTVGD
jgi:hypothetical protein